MESSYSANKFDLIGNVSSEIKINTKGYSFHSIVTALNDNKLKLIGYYYKYENNLKADEGKTEYFPVDENIKGMYTADADFSTTTILNEQYVQETVNGKEKYSKTTYKPARKVNLYLLSNEYIFYNSDKSYYLVSEVSSFQRGIEYLEKAVFYWGFDILVTKFSSDGKKEWSKQIPFFTASPFVNNKAPDDYHAVHHNDKIYILRREHKKNWENYYEAKSITMNDFELHEPNHECVFLIDEVDKTGNIKTEKLKQNPKKIVKWEPYYAYWYGTTHSHRYLTHYDNNIILLTENEDKDKLEFVKVSLK